MRRRPATSVRADWPSPRWGKLVVVEHLDLPAPVADALTVWLDAHDRHAPGLIEGLYVVGSVALDDWGPGSDVDIVGVTSDPATDDEVVSLRQAFGEVGERLGGAITMDGPIVTWSDLAQPPLAALRPWTLDGEFFFDGDCFEINPVTWFTLEEYGIGVQGSAPDRIGVVTDELERRSWVVENVDTYWRSVRDGLAREVARRADDTTFDADAVEWCALGVARMLLTASTGDVTSKTAAGRWAAAAVPEHAALLDAAVEIRAQRDPGLVVDRATIDATVAAMSTMIGMIVG